MPACWTQERRCVEYAIIDFCKIDRVCCLLCVRLCPGRKFSNLGKRPNCPTIPRANWWQPQFCAIVKIVCHCSHTREVIPRRQVSADIFCAGFVVDRLYSQPTILSVCVRFYSHLPSFWVGGAFLVTPLWQNGRTLLISVLPNRPVNTFSSILSYTSTRVWCLWQDGGAKVEGGLGGGGGRLQGPPCHYPHHQWGSDRPALRLLLQTSPQLHLQPLQRRCHQAHYHHWQSTTHKGSFDYSFSAVIL